MLGLRSTDSDGNRRRRRPGSCIGFRCVSNYRRKIDCNHAHRNIFLYPSYCSRERQTRNSGEIFNGGLFSFPALTLKIWISSLRSPRTWRSPASSASSGTVKVNRYTTDTCYISRSIVESTLGSINAVPLRGVVRGGETELRQFSAILFHCRKI